MTLKYLIIALAITSTVVTAAERDEVVETTNASNPFSELHAEYTKPITEDNAVKHEGLVGCIK